MAALGMMPERYQRIAFGVITRATPGRYIISHGVETADSALYAVPRLANQIDRLAVGDFESYHIAFVHKDDFTRAIDATQPIFVTVHGRVELIVAAHGDKNKYFVALSRQVRVLGQTVGRYEV